MAWNSLGHASNEGVSGVAHVHVREAARGDDGDVFLEKLVDDGNRTEAGVSWSENKGRAHDDELRAAGVFIGVRNGFFLGLGKRGERKRVKGCWTRCFWVCFGILENNSNQSINNHENITTRGIVLGIVLHLKCLLIGLRLKNF